MTTAVTCRACARPAPAAVMSDLKRSAKMNRLLEIISGVFPKRKNQLGKVSVRGPIEKEGDKFLLRIPLAAGGKDLIRYTKGIGHVDGHFLIVEIMPWMMQRLEITEGTIMTVDNLSGEFRIQRHEEESNPVR